MHARHATAQHACTPPPLPPHHRRSHHHHQPPRQHSLYIPTTLLELFPDTIMSQPLTCINPGSPLPLLRPPPADFMTASMVGSFLSGMLMKRSRPESYMKYVFGAAAVSLAVPAVVQLYSTPQPGGRGSGGGGAGGSCCARCLCGTLYP